MTAFQYGETFQYVTFSYSFSKFFFFKKIRLKKYAHTLQSPHHTPTYSTTTPGAMTPTKSRGKHPPDHKRGDITGDMVNNDHHRNNPGAPPTMPYSSPNRSAKPNKHYKRELIALLGCQVQDVQVHEFQFFLELELVLDDSWKVLKSFSWSEIVKIRYFRHNCERMGLVLDKTQFPEQES